jgi:hypothetical protein
MYSHIEKSPIIYINNITPSIVKEKKTYKDEYSLKKNCFDPTKMSPPNMFLIKLRERMNVYK